MLSKEQRKFLDFHGIPEELTFNAFGMTAKEYHSQMKEKGKIIAYNVTPCKRSGHALRTRNGHCIQCDTAKIAFVKRNISYGIVYIAGSLNGKIIKVGFTRSRSVRQESLNRTKYAGYGDWEILSHMESINAADIELGAHLKLAKYSLDLQYMHDNGIQTATEVFCCSFNKAKESIQEIITENNYKVINVGENQRTSLKYDFRNLIKK